MPEMDGVAATQAIRALDDTERASIPIIALTANAMAGSRDTYIAAGMDEYVSKPIDAKLLNNALTGIGGQQSESSEPDAAATTTARPPAEPELQHQDELAELVGSLDQLVGPSDDG